MKKLSNWHLSAKKIRIQLQNRSDNQSFIHFSLAFINKHVRVKYTWATNEQIHTSTCKSNLVKKYCLDRENTNKLQDINRLGLGILPDLEPVRLEHRATLVALAGGKSCHLRPTIGRIYKN